MKISSCAFALFLTVTAATGFAQSNQAVMIMPRVAFPDGSNASRAPFPAQRRNDDVHAPDGQAIDPALPPNTAATHPPILPAAKVAVLEHGPAPRAALAMTGLPATSLAASLDAARVSSAILNQPAESRGQVIADVQTRMAAADGAISTFEETSNQMDRSSRRELTVATDATKEREAALFKTLRAARRANPDQWDATRAELASDYNAFAAAAAQVDAVTGMRR
ncbi:MAG TPA: hypothetical protein VHD62_17670 [Opitutaceae bacterium]|nr:hypothetical protein [Opitutaceae bacterium]